MDNQEKEAYRKQIVDAVIGHTLLFHAWLYLMRQGESAEILMVPLDETGIILGARELASVYLLNDHEKYPLGGV